MYNSTTYNPKLDGNKTGVPITTRYGVTQGRKTSANVFTFVIDDMPHALITNDNLFHEIRLLQSADDTVCT